MASVAKRGEKWAVRHVDRAGKHRQKTFLKKKDADAFRARVETDAAQGVDQIPQSALTVARIAQEFMASRRQMIVDGTLARSTFHREDQHITNHILPLIGGMKLQELTERDVDKLIGDLKQKRRVFRAGTLSLTTVKQTTRTLAMVLDFARRRKLVRENVAREVLSWSEHRKGGKVRIRTFSIEQVKRLMISLEQRRKWQMDRSVTLGRAMVYLAAFCGLRFGEICGLTLDDLDFDRGVINIRHSLDRWDTLKAPKTAAGIREVPMPPPVASAIAEWTEAYGVANKRKLVLTTKLGKPMTKEPFHRDVWRPMLDCAGLGPDETGERFHFHALRHFFASMMVQNRFSLTDVAQLMGHASFDMTLSTYAHPIIEAEHRHVAVGLIAGSLLGNAG